MWKLIYRWASRSHPHKSKTWIVARYFGGFHKSRNDRWVFGDRDSGAYLVKFAWTGIVRHTLVKGRASPDDPDLADYWAERRRKVKPPLDTYTLRLLPKQGARCPLCGDHLLSVDQPPQSPREWERWWLNVTRRAKSPTTSPIMGDRAQRTVPIPASYTPPAAGRTAHAGGQQHCTRNALGACLSRVRRRVARTVLSSL